MRNISFHWLLLFLLGALFLVSCSKEPLLQNGEEVTEEPATNDPENISKKPPQKVSLQRSKSEVLELATRYFQMVEPEGATLRSVRPEDFNMEYILSSDQKLRGSSRNSGNEFADTLLYIVNRANDAGFCIISGDKRLPDLLAVVENGHLDPQNVDPRSGVAVFLSRLPIFLARCREKLDPRFPGSDPDPRLQPVDTTVRDSGWHDCEKTPNYVPVTWGQRAPYNNNAPRINGKPALAGCVAVATAQLLAAHKYPTWYKGMRLDWNLLTKKGYKTDEEVEKFNRQVAHLLRGIGDDLGNDWGIGGTDARTQYVPDVLKSLGYTNVPRCETYNFSDIIYSLKQRRPVILRGDSEKYTCLFGLITFYSGGHTWICDGYIEQEHIIDGYTSYGPPDDRRYKYWRTRDTRILLHCNWGWRGDSNGYFFSEVFDSNTPVIEDQNTRSSRKYYYQYNLSNITNIHR